MNAAFAHVRLELMFASPLRTRLWPLSKDLGTSWEEVRASLKNEQIQPNVAGSI